MAAHRCLNHQRRCAGKFNLSFGLGANLSTHFSEAVSVRSTAGVQNKLTPTECDHIKVEPAQITGLPTFDGGLIGSGSFATFTAIRRASSACTLGAASLINVLC